MLFLIWGGTLNITILSFEEGLYDVRAMNGIIHLGGEDLDNKLIEYCIYNFKKQTSIDIDMRKYPKVLQRIKLSCEKVKRTLSSSTQAIIDIDYIIGKENLKVSITGEKFEDLCSDLFKKYIHTSS